MAALSFFLDVVDFSLSWLPLLNRFIFSIKYLLSIIYICFETLCYSFDIDNLFNDILVNFPLH